MSVWAHLYSLASSLIKRPAVWLGGILTAALATFFTTNVLTPVQKFLSEKMAEKACQYRQAPISNDSKFTILVSRLTHDPDRSHTDRVMQAFQNERGFQAIRICESLSLDYSKDSQTVAAAAKQRAQELIKVNHADLLLFGDVTEQNKAIIIYAINENGGCDLQPKPTEIKLGVLPSEFTAEEKEKLIKVSLEEIQKACLNEASVDWPQFAKRMNKMELFLNHFDFSKPKYLYFASSYIDAMRLLYQNGQGDIWFSKGETFAKSILDKAHGDSVKLSPVYAHYAIILGARFNKTKDKNDLDAAFGAYDIAIRLDPKNAYAYRVRGLAYSEKREWDRAIEDYTKAIGLDPNSAPSFGLRGEAYSNKGEQYRAIEDYTKAIGLDPKNAAAYEVRGYAYSSKEDWDRAIADYTKAVDLDPNSAPSYESRGEAYSSKREWDRAIDDFTKAMALDPEYGRTYCYCHRGNAYLGKGDWDRAIEDYTKGIGLDPKNATLWDGRCFARAIIGQLQEALSDCNQSLDLEPNDANTRDSRGSVYLKMGKLEDAISDYKIALGFNPSLAASLYGRGVAKLKKGDKDSGNSDIESAKKIEPDIADRFQRYGIDLKQLSPRPPRSQTSRAHRSRQRAGR